MKHALLFVMVLMLAGCASPEDKPPAGPTKEEIKAREDFAKNLPKPPER